MAQILLLDTIEREGIMISLVIDILIDSHIVAIVVGSFSAGDAAESADSGNHISLMIVSALFIKLVKFSIEKLVTKIRGPHV